MEPKGDGGVVVIIVMGVTGAGKTRFIDLAAKHVILTSNHKLEPGPQNIRKISCEHPTVEGRVILVDTPGFDSTPGTQPVSIILDIAKSLKLTYQSRVKIVRIVYLHRISDNRHHNDSPLENLRSFAQLSGYTVGSVVFATTMWDTVKMNIGEEREALLGSQYWGPALNAGSKLMRFHNSYDSAWDIIKSVTSETSTATHTMLGSGRSEAQKSAKRNLGSGKSRGETRRKMRELKGSIAEIFGDRNGSSCIIM